MLERRGYKFKISYMPWQVPEGKEPKLQRNDGVVVYSQVELCGVAKLFS